MGNCKKHDGHDHKHGSTCGHQAVQHEGHTDYLHDGHLHHMHEDHVDEHVLDEFGANKIDCTPEHACGGHESSYTHGAIADTPLCHTQIMLTISLVDTSTIRA
jgi:hypothetical protein